MRFVDGPNVYGDAGQSPRLRVDPEGLQAALPGVLPLAGAAAVCDGPAPIGDAVALGLLGGAIIWDYFNQPTVLPAEEHTKNARPSTEEKHEKGQARKGRDQGGEKGDDRRKPYGKRPPDWPGGPYPPRK